MQGALTTSRHERWGCQNPEKVLFEEGCQRTQPLLAPGKEQARDPTFFSPSDVLQVLLCSGPRLPLWAFLRQVLTFSEAGFFTYCSEPTSDPFSWPAIQLTEEAVIEVSCLPGPESNSVHTLTSSFIIPLGKFLSETCLLTCSSFVEKRLLMYRNWSWSALVFRFVLLPRIALLTCHQLVISCKMIVGCDHYNLCNTYSILWRRFEWLLFLKELTMRDMIVEKLNCTSMWEML